MKTDDNEQSKSTPYKVRIYAQAFVYKRRNSPKMVTHTSPLGIVQQVPEFYDEFECPQLAVNHNDLYIKKEHVERLTKELSAAIIDGMRKKGLIV